MNPIRIHGTNGDEVRIELSGVEDNGPELDIETGEDGVARLDVRGVRQLRDVLDAWLGSVKLGNLLNKKDE